MTSTPSAFGGAVQEALNLSRPEDIIGRVKDIVSSELRAIDPAAEIERTEYFNHSFVPDFVVHWKAEGSTRKRDVYLRNSLESSVAAGDVEALGDDGPLLLALRDTAENQTVVAAQQSVATQDRVMLTSVSVLDRFAESRAPSRRSPLTDLVRTNLVRGGRGLLGEDAASSLDMDTASDTETAAAQSETPADLDRFTEVVHENFSSDAAFKLERSARIIQMAVSGNLQLLEQGSGPAGGALSLAELTILLPYLLRQSNVTDSPVFWRYLGGMIDLNHLEEIAGELGDFDLTPLVAANSDAWLCARTMVTPMWNEDSEAQNPEEFGWRFRDRVLSLELENWRVHVTADRRRLRGREDRPSARWDDIKSVLGQYSVASVQLDGLVRKVRVAADTSSNVFEDVQTITTSIDDSFHVPAVTVRASTEGSNIELNFTQTLGHSTRDVFLREATRAAIQILGYRRPVAEDTLNAYL